MSKYDIKFEMSADTVKEAIADFINKEGFTDVIVTSNDVGLEVGNNYEDRPGGSSYPVFKKAVVSINAETRSTGPSE